MQKGAAGEGGVGGGGWDGVIEEGGQWFLDGQVRQDFGRNQLGRFFLVGKGVRFGVRQTKREGRGFDGGGCVWGGDGRGCVHGMIGVLPPCVISCWLVISAARRMIYIIYLNTFLTKGRPHRNPDASKN